ncbi:retinol dehydrogenase 13 [Diretmus argenteus]
MQNYAEIKDFMETNARGLTLALAAGAGVLALRRWLAGGVCRSKARLDGKTVLITGANTGIGKDTALDMACRGARVILACRDMTKANAAADEIRQRSGNGNVVVKKLDLASLQSVRDLTKDVLESEERLDILINNAAVMCPKWVTDDGFEMQFGVNHLGHFLLTNCLLDLLKKSTPSRIVIVSSMGHTSGHIDFEDINLDKDYTAMKSYTRSKLANVLFGRELAARLQDTGVTVYSLHPGIIRTEIGRHMVPTLALWKRILLLPFLMLIKSHRQGAQTTVYCAVEESLANVSGLYYSDCAPKTPAPQACDDVAAKKLWDLSASMVGLA